MFLAQKITTFVGQMCLFELSLGFNFVNMLLFKLIIYLTDTKHFISIVCFTDFATFQQLCWFFFADLMLNSCDTIFLNKVAYHRTRTLLPVNSGNGTIKNKYSLNFPFP